MTIDTIHLSIGIVGIAFSLFLAPWVRSYEIYTRSNKHKITKGIFMFIVGLIFLGVFLGTWLAPYAIAAIGASIGLFLFTQFHLQREVRQKENDFQQGIRLATVEGKYISLPPKATE
jgi:uncharacterized membrane protein YiaA